MVLKADIRLYCADIDSIQSINNTNIHCGSAIEKFQLTPKEELSKILCIAASCGIDPLSLPLSLSLETSVETP